ncbi:MAG TPA: GyrI-like domain-containing protein [Hanamia sp.]|nr:GyrI-like domain-containing protein [Hanamia sp.]
MNGNVNSAFRILSDQRAWEKWWPNKDSLKSTLVENHFFYNGYKYHLTNKFYNSIEVSIKDNNTPVMSRINIIRINPDSVILEWECTRFASINPVARILNYRKARIIKSNMTFIFSRLRLFLEKKENIYGINFYISMSKDSTMVATKRMLTSYPSTSDIYKLIGSLKDYIKNEGAQENNFPMLNVRKLKDGKFETMVAIPVNKRLSGNGKIFFSRFVPWKVLGGEVKGGTHTINEALHQMEIYIADYQKTAMAIPFQSLVTNRTEEPDTLKWITRIYTPVP